MHLMRAKLLLNAILWDKISESLSSRSSKHCKCVCECVHKHITFQSGKKLFEKIKNCEKAGRRRTKWATNVFNI